VAPVLVLLIVAVAIALGLTFVILGRRRSGLRKHAVAPPRPAGRAEGLGGRVRSIFVGREPAEAEWSRLEELLVLADVGPSTAARITGDLRDRWTPGADPAELLVEDVAALLGGEDASLHLAPDRLSVVLVVGVNGSGKTTTIGKLAARLAREGRNVAVAGSDTFRAAASEQLEVWAARAGAQLVSQQRGADPGAVAFDAVRAALARGTDVLIVDTAGRLHTKTPLMDELGKVRRVIEKAGGTIDETLLVLDATTGQNGLAQAAAFTEAVDVTGVALTKLDGTAKGGIVLAVRERLGVPVKLIGTGEDLEDLRPFEPRDFAERLLAG
jgi:fused signal recognition particle receptor